jgi:DNA-3-methyladenine glycosylase
MAQKQKLFKDFYTRELQQVAKELLGKIISRRINNAFLSGRIVEVEAYDGSVDEASHSFNGKTKRNEVMFGGGGYLYVYFTYGMHFCVNVVTGNLNDGKAILIRGIEPVDGISLMKFNRYGKDIISQKEFYNITNGPAKIAQAFRIGRNENGIDLTGNDIFLLDAPGIPDHFIECTTRIGIKKSVDLPWRYYIKDNPFVSRK